VLRGVKGAQMVLGQGAFPHLPGNFRQFGFAVWVAEVFVGGFGWSSMGIVLGIVRGLC